MRTALICFRSTVLVWSLTASMSAPMQMFLMVLSAPSLLRMMRLMAASVKV